MTVGSPMVQACAFGPLAVQYDERVLTPRVWTLLQSRWAAELALDAPAGPLLELFAGAGQIGQAAAMLSGRSLVQVEASPVAAGYAVENARAAGIGPRVDVRTTDIASALAPHESFPLMLADPPYLPTRDVPRWPDDPRSAIDGGADGLDLVRRALRVASEHLLPGGALLLQVAGAEQAEAVTEYVESDPGPAFTCGELREHDPQRAVLLLRRR
jgi:methylase of polypeptide subunit release factors